MGVASCQLLDMCISFWLSSFPVQVMENPQSVDLPAVSSSLASCSSGIVGVVRSAMVDATWGSLQL